MVHRLFIGANNATHEVERESIILQVSAYFEGFTCYASQGYWRGTPENGLVVEIQTDESDRVTSLIGELKASLHQEAIGYQQLPDMRFA